MPIRARSNQYAYRWSWWTSNKILQCEKENQRHQVLRNPRNKVTPTHPRPELFQSFNPVISVTLGSPIKWSHARERNKETKRWNTTEGSYGNSFFSQKSLWRRLNRTPEKYLGSIHPQNLATSPENSEALKESKTKRYNKTQIDFIERDLFGDEPGYCDIVFISQYNCQL